MNDINNYDVTVILYVTDGENREEAVARRVAGGYETFDGGFIPDEDVLTDEL